MQSNQSNCLSCRKKFLSGDTVQTCLDIRSRERRGYGLRLSFLAVLHASQRPTANPQTAEDILECKQDASGSTSRSEAVNPYWLLWPAEVLASARRWSGIKLPLRGVVSAPKHEGLLLRSHTVC